MIKDARAKDSEDEEGNSWWREHEDTWGPDPRDPSRLLPNEILAMYTLRSRTGSENIVFLRNFKLIEKEERMLMYLEFCEHGDMEKWTKWYDHQTPPGNGKRARDWTERDWMEFHEKREAEIAKREFLPEPFLWHVFGESLFEGHLRMS